MYASLPPEYAPNTDSCRDLPNLHVIAMSSPAGLTTTSASSYITITAFTNHSATTKLTVTIHYFTFGSLRPSYVETTQLTIPIRWMLPIMAFARSTFASLANRIPLLLISCANEHTDTNVFYTTSTLLIHNLSFAITVCSIHNISDIMAYNTDKCLKNWLFKTRQAFISMWQPGSWISKIPQIYM